MKLLQHGPLAYWFSPAAALENAPLVLFLHGKGERGPNADDVLKWGLPKLVHRAGRSERFSLIAPQCPKDKLWSDVLPQVADIILTNSHLENFEDAPMIATGYSMGGTGALEICAANPGMFRSVLAVAPRNSVALRDFGYAAFKESKAILFHGEKDECVPVEDSREIDRNIRESGGDSELSVLKDSGHFIADEVFELGEFQRLIEDVLMRR